MDYPFEELQKRFLELPENLRRALSSTEVTVVIQEIAESHNLMIDQQEVLYNLIACVMLGIIGIHDFKDKLISDLKMPESDAVALINEVESKIFAEFKKELFELNEKSDHQALASEGITISHEEKDSHVDLPLPPVPASLTPKTMNVAGQSFVNAFLAKPVSTTQEVKSIPVGTPVTPPPNSFSTYKPSSPQNNPTELGSNQQTQSSFSSLSPIKNPATMSSQEGMGVNGTNNPANTVPSAPKTYTVDPYKEPLK